MLTFFGVLSGVATVVEPLSRRANEVPELASMALLSVVLAGASVVVRRTGPKATGAARDARYGTGKP